MPGPDANRLSRAHQAELAALAALVEQQTRRVAATVDVRDVDGWWRRVAADLLALVAAMFGGSRALGVRYLRRHATLEGVQLEPTLARWDSARAATGLRVTGPVEFKRAIRADVAPGDARHVMATTLAGAAQRLALAGQRDTVAGTVRDSDVIVGWRRQTDADPCFFCAMLASRGSVYKTAATAGDPRFGGTPYHDHDQCVAVPLYEREEEPPEVQRLAELWQQVTAGRSGKAAIREWRRWWDEHRGEVDLAGGTGRRDQEEAERRDRERREVGEFLERLREQQPRRAPAPPAAPPPRRNPEVLTGANRFWWEQLHEDTDQPLPVRDLEVDGYTVRRGRVWRRDGIAYLVENGARPRDPARIVDEFERLHRGLPDAGRYQHAYLWLAGRNPQDADWAQKYGIPGFESFATAGDGATRVWGRGAILAAGDGPAAFAEELRHEFGHNVGRASATRAMGLGDRSQAWQDAVQADHGQAFRVPSFAGRGRAASIIWGLDPGRPFPGGVTRYGTSSVAEDYAESVSLYLSGEIGRGTLAREGPTVGIFFRDIFPARAAILDRLFPEVARRQLAQVARR